jgi:hypothetical protein
MKNMIPDEAQIQELVRRCVQFLQPLADHVKSSGCQLFIRLPDGRDFALHFLEEEEGDRTQ